MIYIEMSREEAHGGGTWTFPNCVWSPILKSNGAKWAFWSNILKIRTGDIVIHLRGKSPNADFVGYSIASSDGFKTDKKPPNPTQWSDSDSFYRADLQDFTAFYPPINLVEIFANKKTELLDFFKNNKKMGAQKINLFYVYQSKRLQCLNGAYLSEASEVLIEILFGSFIVHKQMLKESNKKISVETSDQLSQLKIRIGQSNFSNEVKKQYGNKCCFPGCQISDKRFLIASHIARWSDNEELRGKLGNGLCLCVFHDKAFEIGLFTLDEKYRIKINENIPTNDESIRQHLLLYEGKQISSCQNPPLDDALLEHWTRVNASI